MGKGYNNFMSKKAFHPGSFANQKRIHEAEARAEAKRKHDEETLAQYQKEQELFNQKSLVSRQSKEKLSLNFMYEAPPGVEKPGDKIGDKVEWKGPGNSRIVMQDGLQAAKTSGSGEPSICLEWKRDRPARKNAPEPAPSESAATTKLEIKKEIKTEPKKEPSTEPKIDLTWRRDPIRPAVDAKHRRLDDIKPDMKRIKKEQ